jgi:hypothetical protein
VLSAGSGQAVPEIDPERHPTLAALTPAMAEFGSEAEFDRMLDAVLGGIAARAAST